MLLIQSMVQFQKSSTLDIARSFQPRDLLCQMKPVMASAIRFDITNVRQSFVLNIYYLSFSLVQVSIFTFVKIVYKPRVVTVVGCLRGAVHGWLHKPRRTRLKWFWCDVVIALIPNLDTCTCTSALPGSSTIDVTVGKPLLITLYDYLKSLECHKICLLCCKQFLNLKNFFLESNFWI